MTHCLGLNLMWFWVVFWTLFRLICEYSELYYFLQLMFLFSYKLNFSWMGITCKLCFLGSIFDLISIFFLSFAEFLWVFFCTHLIQESIRDLRKQFKDFLPDSFLSEISYSVQDLWFFGFVILVLQIRKIMHVFITTVWNSVVGI